MKSYLKKLSVLAIAAASAKASLVKRDPYWIKMSDVIQLVRPDFYYGVATTKSFFANPKYKDIVSTYNLHSKYQKLKINDNYNIFINIFYSTGLILLLTKKK